MTAAGRITTARITVGDVLRVVSVGDGSARPASNRRDSVPAIVTGIAQGMSHGHGYRGRAVRLYALQLETADGAPLMSFDNTGAQTHMTARDGDWQPVPAAAPAAALELASDDAPAVSLERDAVPASIAGPLQFLSGMPRADSQPAGDNAARRALRSVNAAAPAVSLRKPVSLAKRVRPATIVRRVPVAALEPAHDCGPSPAELDAQRDAGDDGCVCESVTFSRWQCDGCGCRLAGERNGATHFPAAR